MTGLRGIASAIVLLASSSALAEKPPATDGAGAVVPASVHEKLICRTEESSGTRLGGHKTCMTVAQWRAQARDNADYLDQATRVQGKLPGGG